MSWFLAFVLVLGGCVASSEGAGLIGEAGHAGCRLNVTADDGSHLTFDFFRVSELGETVVDFLDVAKLSMRICKDSPVVGLSSCHGDSSICAHLNDSKNSSVVDAGSRIVRTSFSGNALTVTFEGKDRCVESDSFGVVHDSRKNFSTVVVFECEEVESSPIAISAPGCEFLVSWKGLAGCPVQETKVTDNCILAQSGHSFDLRPLRHKSYYTVKDKDRTFLMNFCAPIDVLSGDIPSGSCPSGVAAVCELPASANERVGSKYLTKGSLLKYSLQMGLVMEYSMGAVYWPKDHDGRFLGDHFDFRSKFPAYPARGRSKAIVKFECSEALTEPVIKFVSEDGGNVKFVVESSVTCLSLPSTCQFSAGKGTHLSYDLSALHKRTGNWEVSTPEGEYHFNLCGGLNPIEGLTCSGGATAACRVDKKTTRPLSLGTHFERPFITPGSKTYDERSIVLTYVGGSVCKSTTDGGKKNNSSLYADESKTERRHSLVLRLSCSMFNSKRPHFEGFRPEDCTHHVVWQTAEACPIEFARGKNCEVSLSHDADRHFNFNSLRNSTNDYIIPANNITFRMNLCGPLVHPCSKDKYASVCMIENETGREVVVGRGLLTEPVFSDGKLTFSSRQVGDSCSGGSHPSSVIFIVICDYKDLNSQPQFFTQDGCLFYFVWSTVVACWNRVQSSCSAVGQLGQQKLIYDLSPLTMTSDNYRVPVRPGVFIYLNVCHSVVPTYGMLCHPSAAACLVNMTTDPQNRAVSIGTIETEDSPEIVDGQLVLRYRSGDICYNGADGSITTLIQFKCDPNSHLTAPHLVSAHGCSYLLEWTTSAACPNISSNMPSVHADWQSPPKSTQNTVLPSSTSGPSVEHISSPCTVKSPLTDKLIDLSSLMDQTFPVIGDSELRISVCRPLRSDCPGHPTSVVSSLALRRYRLIAVFSSAGGFIARVQGATDHGACLETELGSRDLGTANTDLLYSPETGVYLSYTGEGGCSTVIEFMCRPTDNHVVVADRIDRCQTRLIFETVLVCEDELAKYCCHGENGALCTGFQGDHEIKMFTHNGMPATVWLSVCRPLSESGLAHCGSGVSACLVENDSPTSGTHVLGYPFVRPSFLGGGLISLIYTGGDSCPNSAERYSTSVIFRCDKNAGEGSPKFLDMDGCRYRFEWRTSVICTDIGDGDGDGDGDGGGEIGGFDGEGALTDACPSAIDSSPLFKSLLVNLSKTQDIVVVSNTSRTEYKIRLCSTDARDRSLRTLDDNCRIDGVICTRKLDGTSMGDPWKLYAHFKTVDVTESVATLHHRVASAKDPNCSADIHLICDTGVVHGHPVIKSERDCELSIEWRTSWACLGGQQSVDPLVAEARPNLPVSPSRDQDHSGETSGSLIGVITGLVCLTAVIGLVLFVFRRKIFRKNNRSQFRYSRNQKSKLSLSEESSGSELLFTL